MIYCSGMPCVCAALTEADCRAGKYVTLGWEDTPEKRLLLPANGQVLPAENPFRDVIGADEALFAASGGEETVEITLQLCPHCGNGMEAGSTVCPFCGAQLE